MPAPSSPHPRHVILGAGPVGQTIAAQLAQSGAAVRLVSRSGNRPDLPDTVEAIAADLSQPEAVSQAIADAAVVYHCAAPGYTAWLTEFPSLDAAILQAVRGTGARLVVLDNLYGYGTAGTLTETTPYAAQGAKGQLRARMAKRWLEAHAQDGLPVTIARASDFFGPRVRVSALGERVWPQLLSGKPISWFGAQDAAHSYTYVPDLARAMIRLGQEDAAMGKIWHVPSLPPQSIREIVTQAAELAGVTAPRVKPVSTTMMSLIALFVPVVKELKEVRYQFEDRFELSYEAFETAFGARHTDPAAAFRATIDWWRKDLG